MLSSAIGAPSSILTRGHDPWYPLAPLQAGMLYDALRFGRDSGYDVEQVHLVLEERVDTSVLARAFQWVTRRHSALHTEFRWDENGVPQQRIASNVILPVQVENWSRIAKSDRPLLLASFLDADRRRGFDMSHAPLGRVRIFVMGSDRTEVIWTVHHILIDATSLPIALIDVLSAYESLGRGVQPSTGVRPPQYRCYIDWLSSIDLGPSRAHFNRLLEDAPAPPPLPGVALAADHVQPRPELVLRRSGPHLLASARASAERTRTTVETVIHAAWSLVIARYCASNQDIVFGSTRACRRSAPGVDHMVGLLANTLPIRARLAVHGTVAELLQDLRAQSVALRDHEHMPLFEIEHPDTRTSRTLFDTTVTYQKWDLTGELKKRGGEAWRNRTCRLYEQPVPLLNAKIVESDELEVSLLFDAARLDRRAVERIADSLVHTLGEISSHEQGRLDEVSVLPAETVQQMITGWNQTKHPFPEHLLIHELFEARADSRPDAIAVEAGGTRLSYGELELSANRVANALRSRGIGPGSFVAVCLGRTADLIVALIAVAKTGASYVPLDPRYPVSRLSFMLRDSNSECVLTELAFKELFGGVPVLLVADINRSKTAPSTRPERLASPSDVCYAIYTSGTTGNPNGVLLSHRAVINTLDWVNRTFGVGPGDRALFVTSPCFDLSVYDVFGVLGAGATIVVASDAQLLDPSSLADVLDQAGITLWNSAPAILGAVLTLSREAPEASSLRLVMLSGDWIPLTLPDAVRGRYASARVISLGGATEAAIWSNWYPIGEVQADWPSIPYGVPIQNCRYHVLDPGLRPVPVGVAGDLYIGGVCLADGYLNRPELTRERFVDDPFSSENGSRLYRSGDRALYQEDGQLRLLGRQDSQVKIRGYRVELGEIEAALLKIPGVKQGVAVPYVDGSGQKAVGAYVVLEKTSKLDAQQLRNALAETLTSFAVPSRITLLEALPVTANGKIDRKALPRMDEQLNTKAFVPPRTAIEREMVALWEALLEKKPIGITDDFFALGGHSLLAVTLMSRIRSQFGWDVPLEQLIARPTIEALIEVNDEAACATEPTHFLAFNARGSRIPIVLIPGVYGTLFVFRQLPKRFGPDQPVYLATDFNSCAADEATEPTVERMAEACESELLQISKGGPIILGGLSFGMLIAFELGERLRKRGIDVPLLVSLDGMAPGYPEFLPRAQRLMAHVREFTSGDRRRYIQDRMANMRRRFLRLLGREHELSAEVLSASPEVRRMMKRTFTVNIQASRNYRPRFTYPGKLLLFRAERPERWVGIRGLDPLHGWGDFIHGKISVVILPGDHGTILDEANQHAVVTSVVEHVRALGIRDSATNETGESAARLAVAL